MVGVVPRLLYACYDPHNTLGHEDQLFAPSCQRNKTFHDITVLFVKNETEINLMDRSSQSFTQLVKVPR